MASKLKNMLELIEKFEVRMIKDYRKQKFMIIRNKKKRRPKKKFQKAKTT